VHAVIYFFICGYYAFFRIRTRMIIIIIIIIIMVRMPSCVINATLSIRSGYNNYNSNNNIMKVFHSRAPGFENINSNNHAGKWTGSSENRRGSLKIQTSCSIYITNLLFSPSIFHYISSDTIWTIYLLSQEIFNHRYNISARL